MKPDRKNVCKKPLRMLLLCGVSQEERKRLNVLKARVLENRSSSSPTNWPSGTRQFLEVPRP